MSKTNTTTNTTTNIKDLFYTLESKVNSLGKDMQEIKEFMRLLSEQKLQQQPKNNSISQQQQKPQQPQPPKVQQPQPKKKSQHKFVSATMQPNGTVKAVTEAQREGNNRFTKITTVRFNPNSKIPSNVRRLLGDS